MISFEKDIESIPFHIKKPFNIIDDLLIKDCISDMLKVYKLRHERYMREPDSLYFILKKVDKYLSN